MNGAARGDVGADARSRSGYAGGVRFTKMHGLGNDYVFLDAFEEPRIALRDDLRELARRMSDRHTGIGSDGVIVVSAAAGGEADCRMRIINSDGSEGGVCGNGTRCVAKLLVERGWARPVDGVITIDAGVRTLRVTVHLGAGGLVDSATVDMGSPEFALERVPVDASLLRAVAGAEGGKGAAAGEWHVEHRRAVFVSMGNPHMVCFTAEDVSKIDLAREGPAFECHPAFPARMNVHMAHVVSRTEVVARTWERGAGLTRACGSGACAIVAAGVATGRLDPMVGVHMPGGELRIAMHEASNQVYMTGPATEVFSGEWRG